MVVVDEPPVIMRLVEEDGLEDRPVRIAHARHRLEAGGIARSDHALDELGDEYTEEEVRLVRITFISEMAN